MNMTQDKREREASVAVISGHDNGKTDVSLYIYEHRRALESNEFSLSFSLSLSFRYCTCMSYEYCYVRQNANYGCITYNTSIIMFVRCLFVAELSVYSVLNGV